MDQFAKRARAVVAHRPELKAPPREPKGAPPRDPLTISVRHAEELSSLGHTKVSALIKSGSLQSTKVGSKRLVSYSSLKRLLGAD